MKPKEFGKDHWSLLAYIYTQVVDNKNMLDLTRMRVNEMKRGYTNGARKVPGTDIGSWQPTYGTRVKCGTIPDPNHDDIDCLNDLEKAGYVNNLFTDLNPIVQMTDKGFKIAEKVNKHKANGGQFATFEL